jgi:AmmeMemoRadiSam system protein A
VKNPDTTDADLALTYAGILNGIAARSIRHGIDHRSPAPLAAADYPPALGVLRATFVTLETDGDLRGCIGGLEAHQPLAADVAHHAFGAAFHDSRFAPVDAGAWPDLTVSISILSPREPVTAGSQTEALGALRPGVDGLVLSDGARRGVFLPKVWEDVPDPVQFLMLLKRKAGLPEHLWPSTLTLERFTTAAVPPARLADALAQRFEGF